MKCPPWVSRSADRPLVDRVMTRDSSWLLLAFTLQFQDIHHIHIRESMAISWTVVIGPSSGTLIFRRRTRLFSLIRILRPEAVVVPSPFWPMAKANACSGSKAFPGATLVGLLTGKSWYLLSVCCCCCCCCCCCILQEKGFSPAGDALPSCKEKWAYGTT